MFGDYVPSDPGRLYFELPGGVAPVPLPGLTLEHSHRLVESLALGAV